jgi:hypothetical protein
LTTRCHLDDDITSASVCPSTSDALIMDLLFLGTNISNATISDATYRVRYSLLRENNLDLSGATISVNTVYRSMHNDIQPQAHRPSIQVANMS